MSLQANSVVIIGGGVIGTACAHYLSQAGFAVTILEKGEFGKGCSHANCGLISPSHVQPLAVPGAISKTFKMMLQKNSPFKIKFRWSPALWWWMMKFAFKCNQTDMVKSSLVLHQMLQSSRSLYDDLKNNELVDCEFESQGCLFVYKKEAEFDHFGETNEFLTKEFGVTAEAWDRKTMLEKEPSLKEDLAGGWFYKIDAHLRPDKLMTRWRQLLQQRGVKIIERCEVSEIKAEHGKARAVVTNQGEFAADSFIVALGAWTPFLNKELGFPIPIEPGKGYSMTMPRPQICPVHPMLLPEVKVAVTPFMSGYRLGSTMEFAGYDTTLNHERLNSLKEGAEQYLKHPYADPVVEEWYGWRPMTYDSLPVIDYSPRCRNVIISAGHNMLGLSLAPSTGKLVAEMLTENKPHLELNPLSLQRFR
jgi:D-amino-acid dehydrogenase